MVEKRKPASLQVVFWNADGLRPKRNSLEEFVERIRADIVLVNETHLKPTYGAKLRNFVLYRSDRLNAPRGGTAVYVKKDIEHETIELPQLDQLEATGIAVQTAHAGVLKLYAVYCSPNRALLANELEELLDEDGPIIIAGDLNAKHPAWNSRVANGRGRTLLDFAQQRNDLAVVGPETPTHYGPVGRPDVLDIAILKDIPMRTQLEVANELESYHLPVILHLGDGLDDEAPVTFDRVDWNLFTDRLTASIGPPPRIETVEDIDNAVENLELKIRGAKNEATRTINLQRRIDALPGEIRDAIREKNRARRRFHRTLAPEDRAEANRLVARSRRLLADFRESKWNDRLQELSTENQSLWRMAKALRNQKTSLPPIHGERGVVHTVPQKAEAFADNLELQCSPNYIDADLDHIGEINRSVRRKLRDSDDDEIIKPTSPAEVRAIIKRLRVKKAPGVDGINNRMIKHLPDRGVMHIVAIINGMLRLRHFPARWKVADVIFIPKAQSDLRFPQNHRPISLLPCIGKLAEKVVLCRLQDFVREHHVLPDEQFGFREEHSTTHQVLRVVEQITAGFNWKKHTGAVFLDVAKAFDKVWHYGLLHKLIEADVPIGLVKLIRSYLKSRTFRAKIGEIRSSERTITAGVPQGSLLSPLLFAIFTADAPKIVDAATTTAYYADDAAILVRHSSAVHVTRKLQEAVDVQEEWYRRWRIHVNAAKSRAILFTKKRDHPVDEVYMFDVPIPWHTEVKYLGVVLDKGLTFKAHIESARNKAVGMLEKLNPLMNRRSRLSVGNKILLYKTIVRPTLLYASPAWGHAARSHLKKLQSVQNKCLRRALDAPWFVRNTQILREAKLPLLSDFMRETARKTFTGAESHSNPLIRQAVDYDELGPHRHKRPKMALHVGVV